MLAIARDAGPMLVNPNDRGVDHLHGRIVSGCECIHDLIPDACLPPADEAIVAGGMGSVAVWQIAPRRTRSQDPEYAVENAPVVHTGNAAWPVGKHRPDGAPRAVSKFVAHGFKTPLEGEAEPWLMTQS